MLGGRAGGPQPREFLLLVTGPGRGPPVFAECSGVGVTPWAGPAPGRSRFASGVSRCGTARCSGGLREGGGVLRVLCPSKGARGAV